MANARLTALSQTPGWTLESGVAHGVRGGYPFSVTVANYFIVNTYLPKTFDAEGVRKGLMKNKKALGVAAAVVNKNGLLAITMRGIMGNAEKFASSTLQSLDAIAEFFRTCGVPHDNCALCGSGGALDSLLYQGVRVRAHGECITRVMAEEEERTERLGASPRYLLGFVGAVLGAVVGSLPWLIVAIFGYYWGILAMLIPAGAQLGYRLLSGKRYGPFARPLALLAALVGLAFCFIAQMYLYFLFPTPFDLGVLLGEVAYYMDAPLALNTLYLALFGIVGIVSTWKVIPKNQAMAQKYRRIEEEAQSGGTPAL